MLSSHQLDIVERICDRVGIINHGQMVATGTVDELIDAGPLRFWVDVPGAGAGWYDGRRRGDACRAGRLALAARNSPTAQTSRRCCAKALPLGPVHEFRRDRPALTQLFRDVMSGKAIDE